MNIWFYALRVHRYLTPGGSGDHAGLSVRSVSTTTRNLPDQGVASRVFERTQKCMPAAIASS